MRNYTLFILCVLGLFIGGCQKEELKDIDSCIFEKLDLHKMEIYQEQEIGCKFTLLLYIFEGAQYFMLDNYCMDMVVNPIDCEGNELCLQNDNLCSDFFARAELKGILAIAK